MNLNIEKNSSIGIIGESGSGKTTLFNLISGLDMPSSGNIFNFNENIHKDITRWRSQIGYATGNFYLKEA